MTLRIYAEALQMCRDLRPVLAVIARHDQDLVRQIRRAACSVVLNLAAGEHSSDGHRRERFRTARGSAGEVRGGVDAAEAFGLIGPLGEVERARMDKVVGTLSKLAS